MQTTITATLIDNNNVLVNQLDSVVILHSSIQRKLYADIIKCYKKQNVSMLPNLKKNELKSSYQKIYPINSRHYNSIETELLGKISSVIELNKDHILDNKDKIKYLEKSLKIKQKTLDNLLVKINKNSYVENKFDKINLFKLKTKIFYLTQRFNKAKKNLNDFLNIEKTGEPHLCFGSNKLFRQQFQIDSDNNLTEFKSHADWKKCWSESRNKSFLLIGSSDETLGNQNCQIKHIQKNIYELKVNIFPKEEKHADKYIVFKIKLHNDKNNLIQSAVNNNLDDDKSKHQALTYRFYKDRKNSTYKVLISLDKIKQSPKLISSKLLGAIGIDINADHLSMTEVDRYGNLLLTKDFRLDLKGKTSAQSLDKIACVVKKITDYAVEINKPIVIENLNFKNKKYELKSGFNKKYNIMLSSFAYSKIIELIKSRAFDKGIETININPAYTSKIGKFKYQDQYKLTTHQAAAFVIARRGLLSYKKKIELISKNGEIKEKEITVINKEKIISIRRSKYYPFDLPARNNQKQDINYWKEIEQNYLKTKKHRIDLKRKKLILLTGKSKSEDSEVTLVVDSFGVNRNSNPNLLFQPF